MEAANSYTLVVEKGRQTKKWKLEEYECFSKKDQMLSDENVVLCRKIPTQALQVKTKCQKISYTGTASYGEVPEIPESYQCTVVLS